jgi:hypothetical protein
MRGVATVWRVLCGAPHGTASYQCGSAMQSLTKALVVCNRGASDDDGQCQWTLLDWTSSC